MAAIIDATAAFNDGRDLIGGHVYFIGGDDGPVKIGYSATVHRRLRALKNSSPVPIMLLAAVAGPVGLEAYYHARFAEHRLHGEWFARHADIAAEISRVRNGPDSFTVQSLPATLKTERV